jgi:uncharacterized LabA/DUF88 family protein
MAENRQRIIIYVDGFNFYWGLKSKGWRKFYWLDIVGFFSSLLRPHQELVELKYFTAPSIDPEQGKRQNALFSANKLNPKFKLHFGKYIAKKITCRGTCKESFQSLEEKETDVRIATQMISDVISGKCDISILVSADSDMVPPIEFIREYKPTHKIFVYFPPNRYSSNLNSLADRIRKLDTDHIAFATYILPNEITTSAGYIIKKPSSWP